MLLKGGKIKLVKEIEELKSMGYGNIGDVYEIVDIKNGGIQFKFGGMHLGIMSYNEFEEYFKKIKYEENNKTESTPIKLTWTEWKPCSDVLKNDPSAKNYSYKTNGKRVIVKYNLINVTSKNSCHPDDIFDIHIGVELGMAQIKEKMILNTIKKLKDDHFEVAGIISKYIF